MLGRICSDLGDEGRAANVLEQYESEIRQVDTILVSRYRTPHLGNWLDPTDEFVYIVLSRKTIEKAYQRAFLALKRAGDWNDVAQMGETELAKLIYGSGLEPFKARAIHEGLNAIRRRFGNPDLSLASGLDTQDLIIFLADLPGVGLKSALCILLFAFGRPTFPVDAHVGRVLARLGTFRALGIDLWSMDHKKRQRLLADLVPPDVRYSLHVNLIAHGREICKAARPNCLACLSARVETRLNSRISA